MLDIYVSFFTAFWYFFRLNINSFSVRCLPRPPSQRCAALSTAVLVVVVVSSLTLPLLSSLLPSSFVVAAAVAIVVAVVFVESWSVSSTAATATHHVFHSIPIVFC